MTSLPLLCALSAWALSTSALAQGQPPVLQRLEGVSPAQIVPQGSPIPGIRPTPLPNVQPSLPTPPPIAPAAPSTARTLPIGDVAVNGSTVYPPDILAPITANLTGPAVPPAAVETARTRLVNLYRADGYVYTVVNAVLNNGHLRFEVIEGHIVAVKLDGDIGPAGTQVLRFLNHLADGRPLSARALERWLLLASDIPGIGIRSVLNPSESDPGALTLVAQVSRQAYSGLFTSDNRAFQQTGPEELLAVLDFNSFTELGEKTEISLYHTYNDTDTFGQASSEFFVGGSGLRFRIYGGAGEAIPSGDLRAIGYDGVTRVFGGQFTYPLIRQRAQTLNLLAIFDALESDIAETLSGGGQAAHSARASFDSLRVLRAGADYALLDLLLGPDRGASNGASFRLSQGLPALGATPNGDAQAPRVGEQTDFTKLGLQLSRTQTLFQPWAETTVALRGAVGGQFSNNVLPPAEKFYLGGPLFNRGFYFGQVTGDNALQATLELQFNVPVPLPAIAPAFVQDASAQFYAFYDYGEAWNNNQDPNQRLASAGGGVRFYLTQYTEFDLEGTARLTRRPLGAQQVSPLPGSALYWQVLARF